MGFRDWMGRLGTAQSLDLSSDLERGYEAALQIQSIELEYYQDRPVRPELELRIPKAMQAQVLRRFRAALQVCQQSEENIKPYRQELSGQELRQLQLLESVTSRYANTRDQLPSLSRSPEILPRSLLGVVDQAAGGDFRTAACSGWSIRCGGDWIRKRRPTWWPVFAGGATPPWWR